MYRYDVIKLIRKTQPLHAGLMEDNNMTPKDKAEELISKYLWPQRAFDELAKLKVAKECAIIAVNEIIDIMKRVSDVKSCYFRCSDNNAYAPAMKEYKFWQDVKRELEQL